MVLVDSCCRFLSLSSGSLVIGIFIIISSILGILYLLDLSDGVSWTFSHITLSEAIYGGVVTSGVLFIIGVVIIVGWSLNKYKIMKWTSVALLVFSFVRICIAIWRLAEGKSFPSFFVVFVVTLFYVYGSVILWSFYQEERDIEIAKSLRNRAPPLCSIQEATVNPGTIVFKEISPIEDI